MPNKKPILVLGAGSWGTALALVLVKNGYPVLLWDAYPDHLQRLPQFPCPRCTGQEGDNGCPTCLGFGFRVQIAPLKIRTTGLTPSPGFNNYPIGLSSAVMRFADCLPATHISEFDGLMVVTWNVPIARIPNEGRVVAAHLMYLVQHVEPMRGEGGETSFLRLDVTEREVNLARMVQALGMRGSA